MFIYLLYKQLRPVINLKGLNKFIPYKHFKMEGLHLLKEILKLSMQVGHQRRPFVCSIEQTVKEIYTL